MEAVVTPQKKPRLPCRGKRARPWIRGRIKEKAFQERPGEASFLKSPAAKEKGVRRGKTRAIWPPTQQKAVPREIRAGEAAADRKGK